MNGWSEDKKKRMVSLKAEFRELLECLLEKVDKNNTKDTFNEDCVDLLDMVDQMKDFYHNSESGKTMLDGLKQLAKKNTAAGILYDDYIEKRRKDVPHKINEIREELGDLINNDPPAEKMSDEQLENLKQHYVGRIDVIKSDANDGDLDTQAIEEMKKALDKWQEQMNKGNNSQQDSGNNGGVCMYCNLPIPNNCK